MLVSNFRYRYQNRYLFKCERYPTLLTSPSNTMLFWMNDVKRRPQPHRSYLQVIQIQTNMKMNNLGVNLICQAFSQILAVLLHKYVSKAPLPEVFSFSVFTQRAAQAAGLPVSLTMSLHFVRIPQTHHQSEPVQIAQLNLSAACAEARGLISTC